MEKEEAQGMKKMNREETKDAKGNLESSLRVLSGFAVNILTFSVTKPEMKSI